MQNEDAVHEEATKPSQQDFTSQACLSLNSQSVDVKERALAQIDVLAGPEPALLRRPLWLDLVPGCLLQHIGY